MYGEYGKLKPKLGKVDNYLGMSSNFSEKNKSKIDIINYMNEMVDNFTTKFKTNNISAVP